MSHPSLRTRNNRYNRLFYSSHFPVLFSLFERFKRSFFAHCFFLIRRTKEQISRDFVSLGRNPLRETKSDPFSLAYRVAFSSADRMKTDTQSRQMEREREKIGGVERVRGSKEREKRAGKKGEKAAVRFPLALSIRFIACRPFSLRRWLMLFEISVVC